MPDRLRILSDATPHKETPVGEREFVERVLEEWDEMGRANLRLSRVRGSLSLLAQQTCETWGVTVEGLRSGSRRRVAFGAREEFSQMAVKGLGYSGAEVARYLGVTGSCVTRIVAERQLTKAPMLKYQNLQARPVRTSP